MAWRTVILVDDGSSSHRVLAAALDLTRAARPGRVLLALPIAPQETLDELTAIFGEVMVAVVALWTEWFAWHGRIYDDDTLPGGTRLQPEPIG
jgi:predicted phosphoribosyltransferase